MHLQITTFMTALAGTGMQKICLPAELPTEQEHKVELGVLRRGAQALRTELATKRNPETLITRAAGGSIEKRCKASEVNAAA